MITVKFFVNNSERIKVTKDITELFTLNGTLRNSSSIINASLQVDTSQLDTALFMTTNYFQIVEFNRYYFLLDMVCVTNNLFDITGHVDVLHTYSNAIKQQEAIIKRQESKWNLYLNDGSFKIYQNPTVVTKPFPSGFNTQQFVLAIAGGGG